MGRRFERRILCLLPGLPAQFSHKEHGTGQGMGLFVLAALAFSS